MNAVMRGLSGLGLRLQIGLLTAIGVAGMLTLAGFSLVSDRAVTALQVVADRADFRAALVSEFDRALLLANKAEKNFIATGRDSEAGAHVTVMTGALAALDALRTAPRRRRR